MFKNILIILSLFVPFICNSASTKSQDIERHFEKLKTLTQNVIQSSEKEAQKNFSLRQEARQVIHNAFEYGKSLYSHAIDHTHKLKAANLLISTYQVFYGITRPTQISKFLHGNQAHKDQNKLPLKWMQDMADHIHSEIESLPFLLDSVLRFPICENQYLERYLLSPSPFIQLKFLARGPKSQFVDSAELDHYISLIEDSLEKEAKLKPWESAALANIYFIRILNEKTGRHAAYASGALRLLTSALAPCPSINKIDPEADPLNIEMPLTPVEKFARALKNNTPYESAIFLSFKILSYMRQNQAEFQGYTQYTELIPLLEEYIESSDSLLPELTFRKYELLYEKNQFVLSEKADREIYKAEFLGLKKATNIIGIRQKKMLTQQDYARALSGNLPVPEEENNTKKNASLLTSFAEIAKKTKVKKPEQQDKKQNQLPSKQQSKVKTWQTKKNG